MVKCPKCDVYPAIHRAEVRVCPKCGRILDAKELFRLLETLGFTEKTIERIKEEHLAIRVAHEL